MSPHRSCLIQAVASTCSSIFMFKPTSTRRTRMLPFFQSASSWLKDSATDLSRISWQEARDWVVLHTRETADSAKALFRYLSGDPVLSKSATTQVPSPVPQKHEVPTGDRNGFWGSFAGLFGSLRGGSRNEQLEGTLDAGHGRVWQEGEVHADLVRDASGYFAFRYILIDIPSSQSRNPLRIFVERKDGVRENEPVVRWDAH